MALPIVKSLADCANYRDTLEPYLYQLKPLPYLVWEHISNPIALKQLYIDTNPFISGLAFSIFLSPFFLFFAELNQNWSQIDRVWSILPTLYHAHWALYAHYAGISSPHLNLRLLISTIWSIRLTTNYARRGGYNIGSEDYRWAIIKQKIGQPAFFVLDVLFICSVQNILLFLVTSPAYVSLLTSRLSNLSNTADLTRTDYIFSGTILYLIFQTFIADQQQWNFQSAKHKYYKSAKVPAGSSFTAEQFDRGFRTTGLWAYSRHPNFTSEQLVWWSFYLWSAVKAGKIYNWTICGPVIYSLIFFGSTPLTEWISMDKYPDYKEYQEQVGVFLPKSLSAPVFTGKYSNKKKIGNGEAGSKNAEDYANAKKRYDLR